MTLRRRLFVTYVALTVVGMAILGGSVLTSFRSYYLRTAEADLSARAEALSQSVTDWMEGGDMDRVNLLVRRYGAQEGVAVRVFSVEGELLATSSPTLDARHHAWLTLPGVREALEKRQNRGITRGVVEDDDRLYEAIPLMRGARIFGALRMSQTLVHFQREWQQMLATVLGAIALALALCLAISAWFAETLARPIQEMGTFAVRLGSGRLGEKLQAQGDVEITQLVTELNRMSERLASLDNERRTFLANASHELRTPVSNVHCTLEALESGAQEDPELRGRFIRTALDETARMTQLIQELLDLGRLEAGVSALERREVSVATLLDRVARSLETRLRAGKVQLVTEGEEVRLHADPERLQRALLNLLDNALKFSPPGTSITVRTTLREGLVSIRVKDEGSGISDEDLPHIFEQFYTADRSRRRGGVGLGLTIAKRIVESHGGEIRVESVVGEGTAFTVKLPAGTSPTWTAAAA